MRNDFRVNMAPVQPSASVAATGLGIRYIGDHLFALSGEISFSASGESTMIEADTGSLYSKAFVQFGMPNATSGDVTTRVYFNGIIVMGHETNDSATLDRRDALKLIIPPFTQLKITIQLSSGSSNAFCSITGRVYGAEE